MRLLKYFTFFILLAVAAGEGFNSLLDDSTSEALVAVAHDDHYHEHDHDFHHNHDHSDHDHNHHLDHSDHDHHDHSDHSHASHIHDQKILHYQEETGVNDIFTWIAATGSILLISLCGVLGIIIVPFMQRVFYQHLLQFLIALAVGTLAGDALLHLLPHAFMATMNQGTDGHDHHGHGHSHDQHHQAVWLGLVALISMIGFFILEKIVNVLGEWRQERDTQKLHVIREGHEISDPEAGNVVCKNKYSNYCASEVEKLANYSEGLVGSGRDTVIISQHEVHHHGHSHAHYHTHSTPHNISSVAWMVIFGDGIHNMADGLAIGAAFADGYMSGFSTSLAVLFHELPHEIGDFAMLLKAGMTIKQAVFYNMLSSVLAFIGMIIGLLLGTINNFSSWMFTATAGIFLYVALVDMMPELSSGHSHPISSNRQKETHWLGLILQVLGMFTGIFIMLIIALYEHDLSEIFV